MDLQMICQECGNSFNIELEDFGGETCNLCGSHDIVDEMEELEEQNKSYREALEFGVKYLKNSDIKQVQLVVKYLEAVLNND